MLKQFLILAGAAAAPLMVPGVAHAQNAAQNGVLVIYGNDKCPTNNNGEEIVVCQRLDEAERFRIPKTLREAPANPQATESWAVRQQDALAADGGVGPNSCSAVGSIGQVGCSARIIRRGKAEARQRQQATENIPLP